MGASTMEEGLTDSISFSLIRSRADSAIGAQVLMDAALLYDSQRQK